MPITLTRSLLVILIPGGLAVMPWFFYFLSDFDDFGNVYEKYKTLINVITFGVIVVTGTLLESIVSYQEDLWDKKREEEYKVTDNWYKYLSYTLENEPVGFRYLGRMVTTLYFELSMMIASPIFFMGIVLILSSIGIQNKSGWIVLFLILTGLSCYFFRKQAENTHMILCKTRLEINKRIK